MEDESSEAGTSTGNSLDMTGGESEHGSHHAEEVHFTRQETKLVNRSKLLVYVALSIAAAGVSSVVFLFLKKEEDNTMEVEFSAKSREILKQAKANAANMFEELWDMSKTITSHALDTKMTWPNSTVPHFDIRAHDKRSRLEFVGFAPFVTPENREGWERYSVQNQDWIAQDYKYLDWERTSPAIPTKIHRYDMSIPEIEYEDERFQYQIPLWQVSPAPTDTSTINLDLSTVPVIGHLLWDTKVKKVEQYSRILDLGFLLGEDNVDDNPRGTFYQPVFQDFREDAEVVGFMMGSLTWDKMFENVLFESSAPLLVEIEGTCNAIFTYLVTGSEIVFLGYGGGLRDSSYDKYKQSAELLYPKESRDGYAPVEHTHRSTDATHDESHCTYVMNTYPTAEFVGTYSSNEPIYFALVVASVFVFTALVFLLYDYTVQRRQHKLVSTAKRTNAIVSSLFPKAVQDRMMQEAKEQAKQEDKRNKKSRMTDFIDKQDNANGQSVFGKPIADLFPSASIMFGDIVGFTAWSSTREPTHVFLLLESIYQAFDAIAKKRRVFKVETVGDCYVAVAGVPNPCKDHALVMARFARECLFEMQEQLKTLEVSLGPDTSDLGMRIGIHSGPVTAGVLRGERARFQLFGDTMNTTARIETTGKKNRIHLSVQTANILIGAGKGHWIQQREDEVEAKGLGKLRTFWLKVDGTSTGRSRSQTSSDYCANSTSMSGSGTMPEDKSLQDSKKDLRLVDWNVEVLGKLLRQIAAQRENDGARYGRQGPSPAALGAIEQQGGWGHDGTSVLDEVKEVMDLPTFDANTSRNFAQEAEDMNLNDDVKAELYQFVRTLATMHNRNPFHSFDHASHVVLSTIKLLSRIVPPGIVESDENSNNDAAKSTTQQHDHAYSITSDPLTQFGVALSAIIHDTAHPGVPNAQLIREKSNLAVAYNNKSIAEQNSLDLAFGLLMDDSFVNLRGAIYSNQEEFQRFRQIVINSVMATDIMDKDLGAARKARWNKAFADEPQQPEAPAALKKNVKTKDENPNIVIQRKATIVIEHLIQASDVSHTMQHWHVFARWNEKLFAEMYKAYKEGRSGGQNPADHWYKGELGFFDFYVIPLAKKLKECGVFGVSSDEYLTYALQNRNEWEAKGREKVETYLKKYGATY